MKRKISRKAQKKMQQDASRGAWIGLVELHLFQRSPHGLHAAMDICCSRQMLEKRCELIVMAGRLQCYMMADALDATGA